ncbi:DUF6264 family protein [Leucobacter sp. OH1287]|uniref:DUF6264 family protein n=1 Tax=Leucobacter sp. OH1287 TaxID=2491049 RepID=UPI0018F33F1C|nr:DUF6264 family protein [Leucobacter sp. OH1287]
MTENRPQFGEKAPEGWQNPLQSQQVNQEANAAGQPVGSDAETTPQQLNGVPHNLGGSVQPNQPQQPGQYGQGQPGQPYPGQPGQGYTGVTGQEVPEELSGGKKADRIATFVLLGLGFLGTAFYMLALFGMPAALDQLAYVTGLPTSGSAALPSVIIAAIVVLAIYVLTIVFSLLLLRKKKISFWVPLVGAALSSIVFSIMVTVATLQVIPLEMLSDPAFMLKLEEWLEYTEGGYYY